MTRDEVIKHLIEQCGFQRPHAEYACSRLMKAPEVLNAFERWAHTGKLPWLQVGQYTSHGLVETHRLAPIGALLTLADMTTDYWETEKCLLTPYDFIRFGTEDNDAD